MGLRQTREAETVQWNDPKFMISLVIDYFWRESVAELEKVESLHPCTTLQRDATDCVIPTASLHVWHGGQKDHTYYDTSSFPAHSNAKC